MFLSSTVGNNESASSPSGPPRRQEHRGGRLQLLLPTHHHHPCPLRRGAHHMPRQELMCLPHPTPCPHTLKPSFPQLQQRERLCSALFWHRANCGGEERGGHFFVRIWGEPSSSTHHLPNKSADSSPTASTVRRHLTKEERTNPHAHQEARGFYFTWLLFDTPLTSHPYDFILGLDKTDLSLLASMQGFKYDNDESDKELSREDWLLYVLSAQNQQLKKAAT